MLEEARAVLFENIAERNGLTFDQVRQVYDDLIDEGLIDYDIEKEVLLQDDEEEE